jgi:phosphoribosylaminoimidazole-succinocarboxamide synthase
VLDREELVQAIPTALASIDVPELGPKQSGKVREIYRIDGRRVLITTDRISAFDRVLGAIPFKGQVLNQLSAWWFERTADVVANHILAVPDPNVTIACDATPLPVEVVVRGYITGVTSTSLWSMYAAGQRQAYGAALPDGLRKNDALPHPIITPTTKAEGGAHDEPLTPGQIVERGLLAAPLWHQVEQVALALFARGQAIARDAGLILVDTKYEFGVVDGQLTLIDEIHTPDSSRFWTLESYAPGRDPQHLDKEFLRSWYAAQGYRGDGAPPPMPADVIAEVAARYISAYEQLTGQEFEPAALPAPERIRRNIDQWLYRETRSVQEHES